MMPLQQVVIVLVVGFLKFLHRRPGHLDSVLIFTAVGFSWTSCSPKCSPKQQRR